VSRSWALAGLVVVALALGGWRTAALHATTTPTDTIVVGDASYHVTHAEQVKGLSAEDLAGMSHGIQSLVTSERTLVTVSVVVTAGDSTASYDPTDLELVAVGTDTPIAAVGATISAGPLEAHASLEGAVSFVVPRDGSRFELRAHGQTRSVPLLQVDVPTPGEEDHGHSTDAPAPVAVVPLPAQS
jgi:hypothetical protein